MDDINDFEASLSETLGVVEIRPTLRCLIEDMSVEVTPIELRRSLSTAEADISNDPTFMLPILLHDACHPLLTKALQTIARPEDARTRIKAITDKKVYRVKAAAHRGALWRDGADRWWLLAAGRRRDDGANDFYRQVEQLNEDPSSLFPTQLDEKYRRLERAYRDGCLADRLVHEQILQALMEAARSPGVPTRVEVFGALVTIKVERDDDHVAVVEVTWKLLRFEAQERFPADVLAMVPAAKTTEDWSHLAPPPESGLDQMWWTYVPQSWIDSLAVAAELDDLIDSEHELAPPDPVTDGSESFSHWAKGSVVTRSYIEGIEIVGVCGARVVAHRDFESFPVCPDCSDAVELLRQVRV